MKKTAITMLTAIAMLSSTAVSINSTALSDTYDSSLAVSATAQSSSFKDTVVTVKSDYSCTANAVRISWNKVSGASGYRVYRYNTETGKYEKIKTISNGNTTSYRNGNLSSATVYKYKVKAYKKYNGKTVWGKASDIKVTSTKPEAVTFKSFSATTNSITLNWKEVNCDGYQIYQLKNGKYTKITTVKKGTNTYKVSGLSENTKYTFKIRAYKRDGAGKNNFSSFTVKTKSTIEKAAAQWTALDKAYYAVALNFATEKQVNMVREDIISEISKKYEGGTDFTVTYGWGETVNIHSEYPIHLTVDPTLTRVFHFSQTDALSFDPVALRWYGVDEVTDGNYEDAHIDVSDNLYDMIGQRIEVINGKGYTDANYELVQEGREIMIANIGGQMIQCYVENGWRFADMKYSITKGYLTYNIGVEKDSRGVCEFWVCTPVYR
jgi:hypothetical protein